MTVSSTLQKEINIQMDQQKETDTVIDIKTLVSSASRVIAPLGPISTFAARHPWVGLEDLTFEDVANWLKTTRNVEIYPSTSMIQSAKNHGEIDEVFLENGLQHWLNSHSLKIPRKEAERFCR
ncbi:Na-translocating system protein MpsB, partial [Aeromonas veronii]|nr:Na-translocating system protein MpsB [Aeromonas veronii]